MWVTLFQVESRAETHKQQPLREGGKPHGIQLEGGGQ